METIVYNPSVLEVKFANAIEQLSGQIETKLGPSRVVEVIKKEDEDNPGLTFKLEDNDGDYHEIVVRIIQRSDEIVE